MLQQSDRVREPEQQPARECGECPGNAGSQFSTDPVFSKELLKQQKLCSLPVADMS